MTIILNWYFYYLLWNMYSLGFQINNNNSTLLENILENPLLSGSRIVPTYDSVKNENNSSARNTFAFDNLEQDWDRTLKMNSSLCAFVSTIINIYQSDELQNSTFFDTLTQDDSVRKQYSSLPFPAVSKQELAAEREYYKNRQNTRPYITFFAFTFESLNHYLYKGKSNFR